MMTCGCDRVNGIWFPCAEHSIENENKRLKLQIGTLTKERDEARTLAQEEFNQIQRDLAEGERYNALGREENAKLKKHIGALEIAVQEAHRDTDSANRLNGELRTALEIALPSMTHTFSGHDYTDGMPLVLVDGCGKCRALGVLGKSEKR